MSYFYPTEMYRSYAKSIYLEVERDLEKYKEMSPYVFSKLMRVKTDDAMKRMIKVTGTIRRASPCDEDEGLSSRNH